MGEKSSLKLPIKTSQDLSSAALDFTTTVGRKFRLDSITVSVNVNITETITITKNSNLGATYDTVLRTVGLVAQKSFVFRPQGEEVFNAGDEIDVDITNANTTGVPKVEIKISEIN